MIDELTVRNVALIKEATIAPSSRLTVLTGETGAGKSALLSSIKLLVGERADAGAVREGADALEVEGRFYLRGGDPEGVVAARRVSADGRGRVRIDGRMGSVRELASGVGATVDLCGQHEHQRLLQVRTHVDMLDAWAGDAVAEPLAAYKEALEVSTAAASELRRVRELSRANGVALEEAQFVLARIEEVEPREGELEELKAALPRAEHAEALLQATMAACGALSADGGALDAVRAAASEMRGAARYDKELATHADVLKSALLDLEDVASELRDYADGLDFDPAELERMQERYSAIQGILRVYGPTVADVISRRDAAREVVEAASDGGLAVRRAKKAYLVAEKRLAAAADALDTARAEATPRFSAEVSAQMARLQMGTATLGVASERLPRDKWGAQGPSRVEFEYRPGAGLSARPLKKIASGGEISRVMLALKVVLGGADSAETLVFDEVDAGVGGATAVALAAVLSDLANTHQVIVVTHLAQVASVADEHYLVSKTTSDVPETTIEPIDGDARVREVARMLGGSVTDASLAHARELLSGTKE
ncbi:DNA repair protein RecN [Paratractidigestivibacter sp.]|uniref:DNA repair protein RecN n=1 Tax=Paratractidigestivibacter sp. TaxID=2847316 RepID=UPI002AC8A2F5|nr:DNA repair protein RecN [Paratractidigestivibacter sp.]